MLPATHTSLTPLTRLCLARCEIDTHWLFLTLGNVEALSRFEASCTESIWNGWDTAGGRTEGKGRWADVTQALLAHRDSLKHVELTAMSRHTTIPGLEIPVRLGSFNSLESLTIDQSVSVDSVGTDVRVEMTGAVQSSLNDEMSLARRLDSR